MTYDGRQLSFGHRQTSLNPKSRYRAHGQYNTLSSRGDNISTSNLDLESKRYGIVALAFRQT